MSTIVINSGAAQASSYWRKLSWLKLLAKLRVGRIRRALRGLRRQMLIREQRRMLREMPDELLMDIGILRCEIDQVALALVDNPGADPRDITKTGLAQSTAAW
jgi:uncharacterized protein YjiS (DUF1127 family)